MKHPTCPNCGIELNVGKMMAELSLQGKTKEQLRARTANATLAAKKKRLSTAKKKKR